MMLRLDALLICSIRSQLQLLPAMEELSLGLHPPTALAPRHHLAMVSKVEAWGRMVPVLPRLLLQDISQRYLPPSLC